MEREERVHVNKQKWLLCNTPARGMWLLMLVHCYVKVHPRPIWQKKNIPSNLHHFWQKQVFDKNKSQNILVISIIVSITLENPRLTQTVWVTSSRLKMSVSRVKAASLGLRPYLWRCYFHCSDYCQS